MKEGTRIDESSEMAALGSIAGELRETFLEDPAPELANRHLQAMFAAVGPPKSAPIATGGLVVAMRSRRRWVAGAAAAGALVLTGGLAAAGELPATLQHGVSAAVATVGIHVPDPTIVDSPPPFTDNNGPGSSSPGAGVVTVLSDKGSGGDSPSDGKNTPGHDGVDPVRGGGDPGARRNDPAQVPSTPDQSAKVPVGGPDDANKAPNTDQGSKTTDSRVKSGARDPESVATTTTAERTTPRPETTPSAERPPTTEAAPPTTDAAPPTEPAAPVSSTAEPSSPSSESPAQDQRHQ